MFDPEQLLGQMMGGALSNAFNGRGNSPLGGGLLGGNTAGLGLGLLGIAIAAFEHNKSATAAVGSASVAAPLPPSPPQMASAIPPPPPGSRSAATRELPILTDHQQNAVVVIRAMIAAANADGQIDAGEREKILTAAAQSGLSADNRDFLEIELNAPHNLEQVVAACPLGIVNEVYTASLAAITIDTPVERAYLDKLAQGLGLTDDARNQIHQKLGITR